MANQKPEAPHHKIRTCNYSGIVPLPVGAAHLHADSARVPGDPAPFRSFQQVRPATECLYPQKMVRTQRLFQFHFRCPVLEAARGAPPVGVGTTFRHVDVSPDWVPAHTCRHQAGQLAMGHTIHCGCTWCAMYAEIMWPLNSHRCGRHLLGRSLWQYITRVPVFTFRNRTSFLQVCKLLLQTP